MDTLYKYPYPIPYSYPIVKKVMDVNLINIKNIMISFAIRKVIINNSLSKHFLIELGGECYNNNMLNFNHSLDEKDLKIYDNKKIVCYTELWDSYLSELLLDQKVIDNTDLMTNLLFQAFICIATYHNILGLVYPVDIIKADNFLVQTNDYKGYYYYKYDNNKLFLKYCEYNILINDFGQSIIIEDDDISKNLIHQNYKDILNIFKVAVTNPNSDIYKKFESIEVLLTNTEPSLNIFQNIIDKIFKIDETYSSNPEKGTNIINDDIYIIKKTENNNSNNNELLINLKINLQYGLENIVGAYNSILQIIEGLLVIEINLIRMRNDQDRLTIDLILYDLKILKKFAINKYLILSSKLNIKEANKIKKEICDQLIQFKNIIERDKTKIINHNKIIEIENINVDLRSLIKNDQKLSTTNPVYTIPEEDEEDEDEDKSGGRKPTKYISTGITLFIMYKKKKYKRIIYVKEKAKTKYCKINNEYILLSKLKIVG